MKTRMPSCWAMKTRGKKYADSCYNEGEPPGNKETKRGGGAWSQKPNFCPLGLIY